MDGFDLPDSYVLYHGPAQEEVLHQVLSAWTWAANAIGEYHPLLLVGLKPDARQRASELAAEYRVSETVLMAPEVNAAALGAIYAGSAAVFAPQAASPWGSPARLAVTVQKPLVSIEDPLKDAMLGPAAYLIRVEEGQEKDSSRALGAALITVVVEESVRDALVGAAKKRSAGWRSESFRQRLFELYSQMARH
jgi:hypothetical protein